MNKDVEELHLLEDQVWMPDVIPFHMVGPIKRLNKHEVLAYPDGTVMFIPMESYDVFCKPNLENWPFGVQTCSFKLGKFTVFALFIAPGAIS